ncbi:MAG: PHP domain-containing protein, partial [Lachnospiraceae bacterium]|nr:PHP domain-containing protein [Lachnospiraceae bacterium]
YMIVKNSQIEIDDVKSAITIKADSSFLTDVREKSLIRWLEGVFKDKFGREVCVILKYNDSRTDVITGGDNRTIAPYEIYNIDTMKMYEVSPLDYERGTYEQGASVDDSESEFIDVSSAPAGENSAAEEKTAKKDDNVKEETKNIERKSGKERKTVRNSKSEKESFKGRKFYDKDSKYKQYKPKAPADPDIIYGRECEGDIMKISEITEAMGEVVIHGLIDENEYREFRNGNGMYILNLTDFTDTIHVKIFAKPSLKEVLDGDLKKGKFIRVKGNATFDSYENDVVISNVIGIKPDAKFSDKQKRNDTIDNKRVELHCHTQMSDMDGVAAPKDLIARAIEWGHKAIAITDHGLVQAFPVAMHALEGLQKGNEAAADFKIIYGVEGYIVDDEVPLVKNEKGQTLKDSFVVFDIETTGLNPYRHKLIEIGAVKVEKGIITDRFSEFVNPIVSIPYEIEQLTGISDAMLK